jgi:hypothetical protein
LHEKGGEWRNHLSEIFAREVLAMLVRKELLSPEWAERILSWPHSGFNVHGGKDPGLCSPHARSE